MASVEGSGPTGGPRRDDAETPWIFASYWIGGCPAAPGPTTQAKKGKRLNYFSQRRSLQPLLRVELRGVRCHGPWRPWSMVNSQQEAQRVSVLLGRPLIWSKRLQRGSSKCARIERANNTWYMQATPRWTKRKRGDPAASPLYRALPRHSVAPRALEGDRRLRVGLPQPLRRDSSRSGGRAVACRVRGGRASRLVERQRRGDRPRA